MMTIAIMINLLSVWWLSKTEVSKSLNKRRALAYCLALIMVVGLVCFWRWKKGDRKIMSINISLFVSGEQIQKILIQKGIQIKCLLPCRFLLMQSNYELWPWTRAKEVCKALEYGTSKTTSFMRAHCSPENITQKYQIMGLVSETKPVNWSTDSQKYDINISE